MRSAIVVSNPHASGAALLDDYRRAVEEASASAVLASRLRVEWLEAKDATDARALAASAVDSGIELVVAAGGDGTIHAVVEGLASRAFGATLGVLPLGTGNDLARSLGVERAPREAAELLVHGVARPIDVMRVEVATPGGAPKVHHGINVAAGGFSGQVDEAMTEEMKARWGPLAYLRGAVKVLPELIDYQTRLAFDDGELELIDAWAVIVANAKSCAGGIKVAPEALADDGLLDVVALQAGSLLDLAAVAALLVSGAALDSRDIVFRRARSVRIDSTPAMHFNVDGELLDAEPLTFRVLPRVMRVIAAKDAPALTPGATP